MILDRKAKSETKTLIYGVEREGWFSGSFAGASVCCNKSFDQTKLSDLIEIVSESCGKLLTQKVSSWLYSVYSMVMV